MKTVNALITNVNFRFYPEEMKNQIELTLLTEQKKFLFEISDTPKNMTTIYNIFNTFNTNELKGKCCRAIINEQTGNINSIKNIIFDNLDELKYQTYEEKI